jgi:hypothetical protein
VLSAVPVEGTAPTREAYENPKAFWRSAILRVAMGGRVADMAMEISVGGGGVVVFVVGGGCFSAI